MNDYPTLQLGDTGNEVRILQQLLKIVNLFPGSITGSFDTTTQNAVRNFQEINNLEPTGIVNIDTWTLLIEQTATPYPQTNDQPSTLQLGDSGKDVENLQQKLKTTLYYDDEITGEYDQETENAVKIFQLNNGILASGITNDQTWYTLEQAYSSLDCNLTPPPEGETEKYTIQKGDTLYNIAQKFNTTVDELKRLNNLTSNTLIIGTTILIPKQPQNTGTTYTVKRGDTLFSIAQAFNISVDELKKANNLTSNVLSIGQILTIPKTNKDYITYTIKKGDTLYSIARNYNISVNDLMKINNLSTSVLTVGQTLVIPINNIDKKTYTVVNGDTLYSIARKYNTTVDEIKKLNNLTSNILSVGDTIIIP